MRLFFGSSDGRVDSVPADLLENHSGSLSTVFACIRSRRVAPSW